MSTAQSKTDAIYYASLNAAIHQGQYDGVITLQTLKQHGDFGVGSSTGLASELVLLDGVPYAFSADGTATVMPPATRLPFAAVKFFRAEKTVTLRQTMTLEELHRYLDSVLATNRFAAIRISGQFSSISYMCYQPQEKPYPPTKDAKTRLFTESNVHGTIVGFFTPKSALVLNSPNYHFHFVNDARKGGGHVKDCILTTVRIEIDYADALMVHLPDPALLQTIDLNQPMPPETE